MLGGSEGLILLLVVVMLFGGSQIPKLARNLGLAQKELKDALKGDDEKPAPSPSDAADSTTP